MKIRYILRPEAIEEIIEVPDDYTDGEIEEYVIDELLNLSVQFRYWDFEVRHLDE